MKTKGKKVKVIATKKHSIPSSKCFRFAQTDKNQMLGCVQTLLAQQKQLHCKKKKYKQKITKLFSRALLYCHWVLFTYFSFWLMLALSPFEWCNIVQLLHDKLGGIHNSFLLLNILFDFFSLFSLKQFLASVNLVFGCFIFFCQTII